LTGVNYVKRDWETLGRAIEEMTVGELKQITDGRKLPEKPPEIEIPQPVIEAMHNARGLKQYHDMYRILREYLEKADPEGQPRQIEWLKNAEAINNDAGTKISDYVRAATALEVAKTGSILSKQEFDAASDKMADEIFVSIKAGGKLDYWFYKKDIENMVRDMDVEPHVWGGTPVSVFPLVDTMDLTRNALLSSEEVRNRAKAAGKEYSKKQQGFDATGVPQLARLYDIADTTAIAGNLGFLAPPGSWQLAYLQAWPRRGDYASSLLGRTLEARQAKAGHPLLLDQDEGFDLWRDWKRSLEEMPNTANILGSDVELWRVKTAGDRIEHRFVSDSLPAIWINGDEITTMSRDEAMRRGGSRVFEAIPALQFLPGISGRPAEINSLSVWGPFEDLLKAFGGDGGVQRLLGKVRGDSGRSLVPGLDVVELPDHTGARRLHAITAGGYVEIDGEAYTTYTPDEAASRQRRSPTPASLTSPATETRPLTLGLPGWLGNPKPVPQLNLETIPIPPRGQPLSMERPLESGERSEQDTRLLLELEDILKQCRAALGDMARLPISALPARSMRSTESSLDYAVRHGGLPVSYAMGI
jgi:hypothetical protein